MTDLSLSTRHTIVSLYARGRRTEAVASLTGLPAAIVAQVGRECGGADMGALARAAEDLRRQIDEKAPVVSVGASAQSGIEVLRAQAERYGSQKLVTRAVRIASMLDQLRVDLEMERDRRAARAKAAAEKAEREAKRQRLAELRAEAAILAAELKAGSTPRAAKRQRQTVRQAKAERRAVRDWAKAQGLECADTGLIPKRILDAHAEWLAKRSDLVLVRPKGV